LDRPQPPFPLNYNDQRSTKERADCNGDRLGGSSVTQRHRERRGPGESLGYMTTFSVIEAVLLTLSRKVMRTRRAALLTARTSRPEVFQF
jgi:hypothetical protein